MTEPAQHPYGLDAGYDSDVAADEGVQDVDAVAMAQAAPTDQDAETGPVAADQTDTVPTGGDDD